MTTETLFAIKQQLNSNYFESSARLASWAKDKRGVMGLLNDDAKQSIEYRTLKAQADFDHEQLRQFNKIHYHNKELIKMTKDDIMQRRMAKLTASK